MKRFSKHTFSIILMCSSIALLLVFQYFWLRKVYEEQRTWLQKEADNLFHEAIVELQDSLFQSKIDHSTAIKKDSVRLDLIQRTPFQFKTQAPDTLIYFSNTGLHNSSPKLGEAYAFQTDSLKSGINITLKTEDSTLRLLRRKPSKRALRFPEGFPISPDSIRSIQFNKVLQRVVMNVQGTEGNQEVIIRIENDSLPISSVKRLFANKLRAAGMPIQFEIRKEKMGQWEPRATVLEVGPVPAGIPPREMFAAQLLHYQRYLLQKTVPQVLFSVFLISITALAFWLVYKSLRQQQRLTALKNDFISNITHELKTPIATVSVAIEALRNFNALQNPQLTKEYLDISQNELNRLTILVDKVLRMSVFEQKEPELQLEPVNMEALVQQITASMRLQFEKHDAQVSIQSSGTDFTLDADRLHLTSVVYNLIDNALKYSPEAPRIDINLEQQNGHIRLLVQDNGIGIAPEYRQRIFEKFFRVPTGDVHNVKGYGLGLNYVSSVVQKHGGKIEVESVPGKGSCFTVVLPRT